jgi:hypothetical protein
VRSGSSETTATRSTYADDRSHEEEHPWQSPTTIPAC